MKAHYINKDGQISYYGLNAGYIQYLVHNKTNIVINLWKEGVSYHLEAFDNKKCFVVAKVSSFYLKKVREHFFIILKRYCGLNKKEITQLLKENYNE